MKRYLHTGLILLIFIFFLSVFYSCSSQKVDPTSFIKEDPNSFKGNFSSDYKVTQEVSMGFWDVQDYKNSMEGMQTAQLIEDKFGIKLKIVPLRWNDWEESLKKMAAADSLPDVIPGQGWSNPQLFTDWVKKGLIRELPYDLLEKYPHVKKAVDLFPEERMSENKIYFIPRLDYTAEDRNGNPRGFLFRKDYAENLNIPIGDSLTWDEFNRLLTLIAHHDPDGNGKPDTYGLGLYGDMEQILTIFGYQRWVYENDKWIPGAVSSYAKEAVRWMRDMYLEGVLDPDSILPQQDAAREKLCRGQIGVLPDNSNMSNISKDLRKALWEKINPDKDISEYIGILPLPSAPDGKKRWTPKKYWSVSYFSSKVDDERLQRILNLYDWLFTKEGYTSLHYGEVSIDYNVKDRHLIPLRKTANGSPLYLYQISPLAPLAQLASWHLEGSLPEIIPPEYSDWDMQIDYNLKKYYWPYNYSIQFADSVPAFDSSLPFFEDFIYSEFARLIYKSSDYEKEWNTYINELYEKYDMKAMIEQINHRAQSSNLVPDSNYDK